MNLRTRAKALVSEVRVQHRDLWECRPIWQLRTVLRLEDSAGLWA